MAPMTAKEQREEFLRRDRERLERLATGEGLDSTGRLMSSSDLMKSWLPDMEAPQSRGTHGLEYDDDDDAKESETEGTDESEGDLYESEPEPLNLPESTHTLFFTHPTCSVPFMFALLIVVISIMCLAMAFTDNLGFEPGDELDSDNPLGVPANVNGPVRIAQYLGILIALLMEEEIPTGAYLLRMVPQSVFNKKFPNRSYRRFVGAAMLRLCLGYIFLCNVFLILVKATGVLDIFYDVLALQFISELDDIAFSLCKLDVLGKHLQRACTAKLFQTEFEKQAFRKTRKASIFLKSVYVVNLAVFLTLMAIFSQRQMNGYYQCNTIKVDFGDAVWGGSLIKKKDGSYEERTLAFSTFNGNYEKSGTLEGRPVYQERRKFDRLPYDKDSDKIPAEIKYDGDLKAWVFTHQDIVKKKGEKPGSWLLRSPETEEYDVLNVVGNWQIWFGVIDSTHVTISCTTCSTDTDCNLNGKCNESGECECNTEEDVRYLGAHCEVKLKDECETITDENFNSTWSILEYASSPEGPIDTLFEEYNRPVYVHVQGIPGMTEDDFTWLLYTGRRWMFITFNPTLLNITFDVVVAGTTNFHAFWDDAFYYDPQEINMISDPTTGDNPVGVDWFQVTGWGSQFGPFGALEPMQKHVGRGIFGCLGSRAEVFSAMEVGSVTNATELGDGPNASEELAARLGDGTNATVVVVGGSTNDTEVGDVNATESKL